MDFSLWYRIRRKYRPDRCRPSLRFSSPSRRARVASQQSPIRMDKLSLLSFSSTASRISCQRRSFFCVARFFSVAPGRLQFWHPSFRLFGQHFEFGLRTDIAYGAVRGGGCCHVMARSPRRALGLKCWVDGLLSERAMPASSFRRIVWRGCAAGQFLALRRLRADEPGRAPGPPALACDFSVGFPHRLAEFPVHAGAGSSAR